VKILLDTHVYLWWVADSRSLSKTARERIAGADAVFVSAASIWEAIIKIGIGKLAADPGALVRGIAGVDSTPCRSPRNTPWPSPASAITTRIRSTGFFWRRRSPNRFTS